MTATDTALRAELAEDVRVTRRRVRAALGQESVDLLLRNCQLVNTYAEQIHAADIAVLDGRIVAVRESFEGEARQTVDCAGAFALPGLIEPRLFYPTLSAEGARAAVVGGTTSVVAWGHGAPEESGALETLTGVPWRVYAVAESGLPARFSPRLTPVTVTAGLSLPQGEDLLSPLRDGRSLLLAEVPDGRPLAETLATIVSGGLDTRHVCLGEAEGRVSQPFAAALDAGLAAPIAAQLGSLNAATHYGLNHEIGSLTPGRWADVVLRADPAGPAAAVYVGGRLVASEGHALW
jgi:adenine deaminase